MTTWSLLCGLKAALENAFAEKHLVFAKDKNCEETVLPHVFIGALPPDYKSSDWPHVMIELPKGITDNEEKTEIPLTIHIGATADTAKEGTDAPMFELLRLLDMTRMIILQNRVVADAFRLVLPVSSGTDQDKGTLKFAIGAISVKYETGIPAPMIMEGMDNGY